MSKTALYDLHLANSGRIVDFAGWQLPVKFSSIIEEHNACRTSVGIFDVSHMGEIIISGPQAEQFINYICCNDVSLIEDHQAQYSALLNQKGGVIDDLIIYRFNQNKYLLCVNASNAITDYNWINENNKFDVEVRNASSEYGQIALQGPEAEKKLAWIFPEVIDLKTFYFLETSFQNHKIIIARTGYSGEDGFEIFCPWDSTPLLWEAIVGLGDITLCGLGARDTLRLEACYPLHGHELSPTIPALSSGLGWIIKFDKGNFIGKDALLDLYQNQEYDHLIAFEVLDSGIVREESAILDQNNKKIGFVTSGTKTPTINKAIGMAIVHQDHSEIDTELFAEVRNRKLKIKIVKKPFYRKH